MKFKLYLMEKEYAGNVGFHEMVRFYRIATPEEIKQMEKIIKREDWSAYKKLIKKKLGVALR